MLISIFFLLVTLSGVTKSQEIMINIIINIIINEYIK